MKYSILIVAIDCHFSHMTRFVCNLKQENPEVEMHYFTNKDRNDLPCGVVENVAEVICQEKKKRSGIMGQIENLFLLRKQFKKMARNRCYDVVDIHYPKYYIALIMPYLRRLSNKIVVTPWGSDILRVEGVKLKVLMKGVINKCDFITTLEDGNIWRRLISLSPNCNKKLRSVAWGSETIDYITHHISETNTEAAKGHFGLSGKYVITCAYNAFPAQNHEKIIDAIVQIRRQLPNNLILLFPVSYGSYDKEEYVAKLKMRCQKEQLDALFVEDYLSVEDVFYLRMATDIFVHVQNTDAGCASLQEYVLCNKKVVHGNWIHYPMFEQYSPLSYFPATDFSSLGKVILDAYHSDGINIAQVVIDNIQHNGWEVRRKEWNDFFYSLTSRKE